VRSALLSLALTAVALAASAATSSPTTPRSFDGERITWQVRYAGLNAGTAWAEASESADGRLVIEGGARNAPWYGKLFSIDDFVRSTSRQGDGSLRYETRFREGGFHQDQDMQRTDAGFVVQRGQRIDDEWRQWERSYDSTPGCEDPISAVHRLRTLADAELQPLDEGRGWSFPVFSGDRTWPLIVTWTDTETVDAGPLGAVQARVLDLHTGHRGMLEQRGRFRVWLTDDDARVPVKLVVKSNFGAIRALLADYRPPRTASPVDAATDAAGSAIR